MAGYPFADDAGGCRLGHGLSIRLVFPNGVDAAPSVHHGRIMRTISQDSSVRLYHLDDGEGGAASTLLYGTLAEALAMADAQPEDVQVGLFLQTSNDVVSYLDYIEG
jgi:hypothetical protein